MTGVFDLFGMSGAKFETLLLMLVRISAMLSLVPVFSQNQVPRLVRFAIGIILTIALARLVTPLPHTLSLGELALAIAAQVFVGLVFGFVAFLLFTGFQFAGEIIDTQIGFAAVNIINPLTSASVTVIGEFQLALATLLYLTVDAHHALLGGMASSFRIVQLPYVTAPDLVAGDIVKFFTQALFIVFEIAAPVAISLFLVNIALALTARVAPQLNLFVIGFPVQITVGLIMMIVSMPLLGAVFPSLVDQSVREQQTILRAMAGPTPSAVPVR